MSGNIIYRHHVEPRVKLYSLKEELFPIPLNYIDVSRSARTNLDFMQETTRRMYFGPGEINEKTVDIQTRSFMTRILGQNGKECQAEGEAKVIK